MKQSLRIFLSSTRALSLTSVSMSVKKGLSSVFCRYRPAYLVKKLVYNGQFVASCLKAFNPHWESLQTDDV